MQRTARFYLSPIAALVTVVIGVGFVRAAETVISLFEPAAFSSRENPTEENIGVTATENFKSFVPERTTHGRVLACYDPTILPIWHELKGDELFKEMLSNSTGVMNCSDMIEILRVDLNSDGNKEILAGGKDNVLCPVGNCGFWVFEVKNSRAIMLLAASDYMDISELGNQVQRSRTRGYSDILLKDESTMAETSYRTYKFDGKNYFESRCVYEIPKNDRQGEGTWQIVSCKNLDRQRAH